MKPVIAVIACAFAAALVSAPAAAHHSAAALYALDRDVTVEGVVTRFTLGNPHMRVYFTRADGSPGEWMAEGGSRTVLARRGWTGEELKPGDAVIIEGNPSHTGENIMHIEYLTLPDGRRLFGEDVDPAAVAASRSRRRD